MTRRDYERLARALARSRPQDDAMHGQWRDDCCAVADALHDSNPRFDVGGFLSACGCL